MSTAERLEWDDLRGKLAADCALGLALCGWLTAWFLLNAPAAGLAPVLTAMGLIVLGLWLWAQTTLRPQRSAILLTAISFAAVAVAWHSLRRPELVYLFAIPILLAALLLRTWSTLVVGAGVWLLVYGPLAPQVAVPVSASAFLLLLSSFQVMVMRGVRSHLTQAQAYQTHVVSLVEQTRRQQEEVNRLNKSLSLAYSLLHRRTQELAVARQEAENALRLKEQFAVYVSHELRTPLNVMLGFLEILQRYPEVYGDVHWTPILRRDIAEIQRSARHLLDLVNDLLDLARIDAVKMPIHRESCRLEDVLGEAVELVQRLLVQKPVQLQLTVDGPLPTLYIDRTRIRQVALNLLANAGRFTQAGTIHVHAARQNDEVVVAVRDTGIGIAPDALPGLFQDYAQGAITGAAGEGKGLGLAIAKRFVQMHGGRIWAESQPGHGSTFYFVLPVDTVQVVPVTRHSALDTLAPSHTPHLVVVDAEPAAATYLRRQLDGCKVSHAPDLERARLLVREQHPDALLLNVPPDHSPVAQAAPVPILAEGVPVIQCTLPVGGWLLEDDCFDSWLVKPVSGSRLLQVMDHYCPSGGCVLLADDDRSFVQLVQRMLQAAPRPYMLHWAYTVAEGMDAIAAHPPDLLLVDIALAGSNGRVLAQWLRQDPATASIPVLAISSFAPGAEGDPARSCSFGLTRGQGFSEGEVLDLVAQTLRLVRPRYTPWTREPVRPAVPGVTAAWAAPPTPPMPGPIRGR